MSKTYKFKRVQSIPIPLKEAWDFFSGPKNLQQITPASVGFRIISAHHGDRMYAGQVIEYKVKPLFGIPLYWMTEITHMEEEKYFVDEQRFGPYQLWHHQHHFRETDTGTEMIDIVHYRLPFWILGDVANALFARKKLKDIFDYREKAIDEYFY